MKLEVKRPEIINQISELLTQSQLVPVGLDQDHLHLFCHIAESGEIIGVVGVEVYGAVCLLRSLTVREDKRSQGIAHALLTEAVNFARSVKSFEAYLLTETIGDIMSRYGFRDIPREYVPSELLQSPFFNGICPCSCQLMHKNIMDGEL